MNYTNRISGNANQALLHDEYCSDTAPLRAITAKFTQVSKYMGLDFTEAAVMAGLIDRIDGIYCWEDLEEALSSKLLCCSHESWSLFVQQVALGINGGFTDE